MKLLSTPQGKSRTEIEQNELQLRVQDLYKLIADKKKELENLDSTLLSQLSSRATKNYEEEELFRQKIATLTEEVENLERRKKLALVPLESREKEVEDRSSALSKREEMVQIKESDVENTQQLLLQRLDEVSEREQDATEYSQILNNRRFNIEFEEKELAKNIEAITQILAQSIAESDAARQEADRRKAILKGRDITITEREKNVEMQEKSFANRERAITDKYQTLLRAITETNLRNNGNNNS